MTRKKLPEERLGEYNGKVYFLYAQAEPDFNEIQDYVVTVFYRLSGGKKKQIARFDTAHNEAHFDRLFENHPFKQEKIWKPEMSFWKALELARNNWRTWASRYEKKD